MAILGWSSPTFNISLVLRICSRALYPGCSSDLKPLPILLALQQPRLLSPDDHRLVIDTSCSPSTMLPPLHLALARSCYLLGFLLTSDYVVSATCYRLSFLAFVGFCYLSRSTRYSPIFAFLLISCFLYCLQSPYSISFPFLSSFIIRHHNFTHTLYGTSHCPSLTGLRSLSP